MEAPHFSSGKWEYYNAIEGDIERQGFDNEDPTVECTVDHPLFREKGRKRERKKIEKRGKRKNERERERERERKRESERERERLREKE